MQIATQANCQFGFDFFCVYACNHHTQLLLSCVSVQCSLGSLTMPMKEQYTVSRARDNDAIAKPDTSI